MTLAVRGHSYKMVAGDVLNRATLGHTGEAGPYKTRAALIAVCAITAAAVVLTNGGQAVFTFTPAANSLTLISGSGDLELDDFTVTTLTDGYVVVWVSI